MSSTTIAYKMGAAAMAIPIYNGDGLLLIAGVSACAIIFKLITSRAWRAVLAG